MPDAYYEIVPGGFQFIGNPELYIVDKFLLIRAMIERRQRIDKSTESQAIRKVMGQLFVDVVGMETIEDIYVGMATVCKENPKIKAGISKMWANFQKYFSENNNV